MIVATIAEAMQFYQVGNLQQAETICRQILHADPACAESWHLQGLIAHGKGRSDLAVDHISRAIGFQPSNAVFHDDLGMVYRAQGHLAEAVSQYQQVTRLKPNYAQAHNTLGILLREQGELNEAVASFLQVVHLVPDSASAYSNLGSVLRELASASRDESLIDQAMVCHDRAVTLEPKNAMYHWNRALALLSFGDFARGWPEFEWRLHYRSLRLQRYFAEPCWDGSNLAGRTILLYTEGGFGDAINFVRYVPLVVQRAGSVILECQPELKSLLATAPGPMRVVARGEHLPYFHVRLPLQSLPGIFGTTLETIPGQVPYLSVDPQRSTYWRQRCESQKAGLRVGVAWAGRLKPDKPHNPSCHLEKFRPLAQVAGVVLYSLQKGEAARQVQQLPGMTLIDWTEELADFADTAALVSQLDLVISVDTSIVHVAGALAKPVWTLLSLMPDFRWLLWREDTPWYPTMRLFRQTSVDDWDSLLQRVAKELAGLAERHRL